MNILIKQYRNEVSRCVKCGTCLSECPTYLTTGDETMVARGRLSLVEAVMEGELKMSKNFNDHLSTCASCLSCVSKCPCGVDPVKIINTHKRGGDDGR